MYRDLDIVDKTLKPSKECIKAAGANNNNIIISFVTRS